MLRKRNDVAPWHVSPAWTTVAKCLFLIVLSATIFLLAEQMVKHRFFRGGWVNQNDTVRP